MADHLFMARQPNTDITKHLELLKARLGYANFKLRNGWEKNTLSDVESFWKERQRQMVDSLPTPRFTQRGILDNRNLHPHFHYHEDGLLSSPTFTHPQHQRRHSHHSPDRKKRKLDGLTRSHSTPTTFDNTAPPPPPPPPTLPQQEEYELSSTTSSCSNTSPPPPPSSPLSTHDDNIRKNQQFLDDDVYIDDGDDTEDDDCHYTYSQSKRTRTRKRTITPPSPPLNTDDPTFHHHHHHHHHHKKQSIIIQPKPNKSSLDYLSYAVAMTENQPNKLSCRTISQTRYNSDDHDDDDQLEDDEDDSDVFHDALSTPIMVPPSPVTAAAEAMIMFGHHSQ